MHNTQWTMCHSYSCHPQREAASRQTEEQQKYMSAGPHKLSWCQLLSFSAGKVPKLSWQTSLTHSYLASLLHATVTFTISKCCHQCDACAPAHAALIEHTKRAAYQAGHCWGQVMVAAPELPSPSDWGWKRKDTGWWEANWTTLPEAAKACRELLHCGCKKGCRGQCKCIKAALQCTALCYCGGLCSGNWLNYCW